MYKLLLASIALCTALTTNGQTISKSIIEPLHDEQWWGGFVALGSNMPYASNTEPIDMARDNLNNQTSPIMVSSAGRYLWSEHPFKFHFNNGRLIIESEYGELHTQKGGKTLREAHLAASKAHFTPSGKIPEELFFSLPQYNTWIELTYNQNQADIMRYAHDALKHDFPPGVFMIDDNWQRHYGNLEFKADRFPSPSAMVDSLHSMGFKVMLWIAPYVSPDSPEFRDLEHRGYLLRDAAGKTAVVRWWNGLSASYDTTNPDAMEFLAARLRENQEKYGVDGFKFDGGDITYLLEEKYTYHDPNATPNIFMQRWAELGARFPYNEIRACWKLGGQPLVQRLGDKDYSWEAIQTLIPDMTAAGLMGYPFTCPDMIGGGQFGSFVGVDSFDQELIVRSAQVHAMMPMMQFSVAPWRILSPENIAICAQFAKLHRQFGGYLLSLARHAARTGEPMIRAMEYTYPHMGLAECHDQFMLGHRYMVAPMLEPGTSRKVWLPAGFWRDDLGQEHTVRKGIKLITIEVPIDRLPYFERIK